jgi:hypothetical protein
MSTTEGSQRVEDLVVPAESVEQVAPTPAASNPSVEVVAEQLAVMAVSGTESAAMLASGNEDHGPDSVSDPGYCPSPRPAVAVADTLLEENAVLKASLADLKETVNALLKAQVQAIAGNQNGHEDQQLKNLGLRLRLDGLIKNIPDFNGDQDHPNYLESFRKFILMVQELKSCEGFTNHDKLMFVVPHLKGQAYSWWAESTSCFASSEEAFTRIPIGEFLNKFSEKFMPRNPLYKLYSKLLNLHQNEKNTALHTNEFRTHAALVDGANAETLAFLFLKSLRPEVLDKVRSHIPNLQDFRALIDYACYSSEMDERREVLAVKAHKTGVKGLAVATTIRKSGKKQAWVQAAQLDRRCYRCGQSGHIIANCPTPADPNTRGSRGQKKVVKANTASTTIKVSTSLTTGGSHVLTGHENNIESDIHFILDSGSERHILSEKCANALGIKRVPTKTVVVTADGAQHRAEEASDKEIKLFCKNKCVVISKPLIVKNFCNNLLSVSCLNLCGYAITFGTNGSVVIMRNDKLIAETASTSSCERTLCLTESRVLETPVSNHKRKRFDAPKTPFGQSTYVTRSEDHGRDKSVRNLGFSDERLPVSHEESRGTTAEAKPCERTQNPWLENCRSVIKAFYIDSSLPLHQQDCMTVGNSRLSGNGEVVSEEGLSDGNLGKVFSENQPQRIGEFTVEEWHDVLGHASPRKLKEFFQLNFGLSPTLPKVFDCVSCQLGKHTLVRPSISKSDSNRHAPCEVVHMDICGPLNIKTGGGSKYVLNLVEDNARYVRAYLLASKDSESVVTRIDEFIKWINCQTGKNVKILRSDNGTEFVNEILQSVCRKYGIVHQTTNPYNAHQNGTVERVQRTLMETVRTWLIATKFPSPLWGELYMHAVRVYNIRPHSVLEGMSPAVVLLGKDHPMSQVSSGDLLPLGSKVVISIPKEKRDGKLAPRARIGWFLGSASNEPGVRCWDDKEQQVFVSAQIKSIPSERFKPSSDEDSRLTLALEEKAHSDEYQISHIVDEKVDDSGERRYRVRWENYSESDDTWERRETLQDTSALLQWDIPHAQEVAAFGVHEQGAGEVKLSVKSALQSKDRDRWLDAMRSEYDSIMDQGTWKVVERPSHQKVVTVTWVLKVKWNPDRTVPQYKARLCARGFTQVLGVDYDETYSPTLSRAGLRLVVAIAVQLNLQVHAVDCKNAFLNGEIDKEIYLEQPEGFEKDGTTRKSHVCRLIKALYGLKQAPLIWNQALNHALLAANFVKLEYEPCIYIYRSSYVQGSRRMEHVAYPLNLTPEEVLKDKLFCILAVYVDDVTIISTSDEGIAFAKRTIANAFMIKDEGMVKKIIGTEFTKVSNGLFLHQEQYATDILARHKLSDCNARKIPMDPHPNAEARRDDEEASNNRDYRKKIGELLYAATCTRPDLCISVNLCARHVESPSSRHDGLVKGILRYLRKSSDCGLFYERAHKPLQLTAYCDSDFAGDKSDSRSTSGYVILLNGCCVSWKTTKQKSTATSTVEAEYMAASLATKEVMWLQELLKEIFNTNGIVTPRLLMDNAGAECLARNDVMSERTKHIRYTYHFIKECVRDKVIELMHVSSAENVADMMTKPLAFDKLDKFKRMAGMITKREVLDIEARGRLKRFQ